MNAPSRPRPPKTMLLIDADNVSTDVMEQAVEALLLQFGALHVRRAYCTAESALKHQAVFKRLGIRPMVNLAAGKNSTDIALAVDALDLVIAERPEVVVIASSDSDFAPLVARLREKGCRVVGIGQQGKTGDETRTVYDDFTVLAHRKSPGRGDAGPARGRGRARGADVERASERPTEPVLERPADRAERAEPRLDTRPAGRSGGRRGGRGGGRGRSTDDRTPGVAEAEALAPAAAALPQDEDRAAAAARAQAVADVMADVMAEALDGSSDAMATEEAASSPPSAPTPVSEPEVSPAGDTAARPARKSAGRRSSGPKGATPAAASPSVDGPILADGDPPATRPGRAPRAAVARRPARAAMADEPVAPAPLLPEEPTGDVPKAAATRRGSASRSARAAAATPAGLSLTAEAPTSVPVAAAETPPAPAPDRARPPGRSGRSRAGGVAAEPTVAGEVPAGPAPAVPDRLRQILMVLPELVRGDTVELRVAAERLREAGLLSRSGSSTKVLGAFPERFELLPALNPNRVRLKT